MQVTLKGDYNEKAYMHGFADVHDTYSGKCGNKYIGYR